MLQFITTFLCVDSLFFFVCFSLSSLDWLTVKAFYVLSQAVAIFCNIGWRHERFKRGLHGSVREAWDVVSMDLHEASVL